MKSLQCTVFQRNLYVVQEIHAYVRGTSILKMIICKMFRTRKKPNPHRAVETPELVFKLIPVLDDVKDYVKLK